jgi:hypothetical protein
MLYDSALRRASLGSFQQQHQQQLPPQPLIATATESPRRQVSGGSNHSSGGRRTYDEELLLNMAFGSVPLATSSNATKIHDLQHPHRIVISKLVTTEE